LSSRAKRVLFNDVKKSRNASLQEITNTFNKGRPRRVSQCTIRRILREEGYQRRVIRKAIRLRVPNRRNRLAWCRGKLYLPVIGYWDRVVFSDESKVEIGANYLFIMNIVQSTHTQSTHKKEEKNYEVHKNSIKAFKTELLNKCNSK